MIYCFDLDGTICSSVEKSQYEKAVADTAVVNEINRLYDSGNTIKIMTARGCVSGIDHTVLTKKQLNTWGVKYHELLMNIKPHADWFIDDKGIHVSDWKSRIPRISGIIAGAFDIIHPGYYVDLFRSPLPYILRDGNGKPRHPECLLIKVLTEGPILEPGFGNLPDI